MTATLVWMQVRPSLFCDLLLPANEVWGKVILSKARVSHFALQGGLCMMSLPFWLPGHMFFLWGVSLSGFMFLIRWSLSRGMGVSVWTEDLCLGKGLCLGSLSRGSLLMGSLYKKVSVKIEVSVQMEVSVGNPPNLKADGTHRIWTLSC